MQPQWDELLERIATGELDPQAPEVLAARNTDPALAAEIDGVLSMGATLDAKGAQRRRDIEEALAMQGAPGEERSAAALRQEIDAAGPPSQGSTKRQSWTWRLLTLVPVLAAAGVLAVFAPRWLGDRTQAPTVDPSLGNADLRFELAGHRFEEGTLLLDLAIPQAGGFVRITLRDAADGRVLQAPAEHDTDATWTSEPLTDWPPSIAWEAVWHPPGGQAEVYSSGLVSP